MKLIFLKQNIFRSKIKSTVLLLLFLPLFCLCNSIFSENSSLYEKQTKTLQSFSHGSNYFIAVSSSGIPAIAIKTRCSEQPPYNIHSKNIFKSNSFLECFNKVFLNYLQDQIHSRKSTSLEMHIALRVLLI